MIKTSVDDCGFKELTEKAKKAMENAYCVYSGYKVGAAVLTLEGEIYTGCNIENGSYGATNCAERTAVFKAVSEGKRKITAVAICSEEGNETPFPCGICRQVLSEFCEPEAKIIVCDGNKACYVAELSELLPYSFKLGKQNVIHV